MGKLSVGYVSAVKKTIYDNKRIFIRFIVSLMVSIILIVCACSLTASAAENPGGTTTPGNQTVVDDSSVIKDLIGVDGSQPLEVILLVTILSLAPSLLVMMTSFGRIIICFSFLRTAMQTQSTPPNMVLTGLALFLTIFIMFPVFVEINEVAYEPYAKGEITTEEAIVKAGEPLKEFMLKQTANDDMQFFLELSGKEFDGEITLENVCIDPIIMHYNEGNRNYQIFELNGYTDDISAMHAVKGLDVAVLTDKVSNLLNGGFLPADFLN